MLIAKEIDGFWIVERPDGTRVESVHFAGSYRTREIAEAVIEYLEMPKPKADAVPEAQIPTKNTQHQAIQSKLAGIRRCKTTELRMALLKTIAERRGLMWTENGFGIPSNIESNHLGE